MTRIYDNDWLDQYACSHYLTVQDMAELLGIPVRRYKKIRNGYLRPNFEELLRFKKIFRSYDMNEIFERELPTVHETWGE